MRRGLFIGGIVLAIVGLLALGGGYAIQQAATTNSIPAGSALSLTPSGIGSTSISVSWSGGSSGTTVYLTSGAINCPGSGALASGNGSSGSLKATLNSGTTYDLYACNGATPAGISVSYTTSGFTLLMVIGIVLLVIGLLLAVVGRRAKPKMKKEPAAAEPTAEAPAS